MHSKGMYLGLQGTRILVGFFEGVDSSSTKSVHVRDWNKQYQDRRGPYIATPADRLHTATGFGARWSNQQRGRVTLRVCGQRCSVGDSSRVLETSRYTVQQKSTPMKCKAAVVMQASAVRCVTGPWMWEIVVSPLFVMVY